MEKNQYKSREKQKRQNASQSRQQQHEHEHVHEQEQRGSYCPHCGALITDTCELCPICGKPIDDSICSFCGTPFEGDDPFCAECGSPREGIKCPNCGTLSFRSFCGNCNTPLNDNALEAIAQAKADPRFQKAQKLKGELEQMEVYLYKIKEEIERAIAADEAEGNAPDAPGLSAEGEKLRNQYAQILSLLGQQQPTGQPQATQAAKPKVNRKRELKIKFHDADKVIKAYKEKQADMEKTLKSMLPDANMTPAQQRDYCCAHKVATVTIEKGLRRTVWECNYCHCLHNQPSECAEPWHGGVWHHEEFTFEKKVWGYLD